MHFYLLWEVKCFQAGKSAPAVLQAPSIAWTRSQIHANQLHDFDQEARVHIGPL